MFGRRGHCRERTSDAEQVAYLLLDDACWHQPLPTRNVRTAIVTCDDIRTLKFTLIVQRMPMSGRTHLGYAGDPLVPRRVPSVLAYTGGTKAK